MAKDGQAYLKRLRDNRCIYIDGRQVADVRQDAAFANAVASAAQLDDYQARADNVDLMTFRSPTSGGQVNRAWQLPRVHAELVQRRRALENLLLTEKKLGPDYWSAGFTRNRPTLEVIVRYMLDDGLIISTFAPGDLFAGANSLRHDNAIWR